MKRAICAAWASAVLAGLFSTTACAPGGGDAAAGKPANTGVERAEPPSRGTIVSVRAYDGVSAEWRSKVLTRLGGAATGGTLTPVAGRSRATEFIVRGADGQTVSVMQPNDLGLRQGEDVLLIRTDRTRLARPV